MAIPQIQNSTTVTKPAEESKDFPDLEILQINIKGTKATKYSADVWTRPYNKSTGEYLDQPTKVKVSDIEHEAEGNTKMQNALVAIAEAVQSMA